MDLRKLINGVSSDHDLITLANALGIHIDEILTAETIHHKLDKHKTYLILLRIDNGIGHWTACSDDYYFDSQGIGPAAHFGIEKYNNKQYQGVYNNFCGIWCLLWLYARQKNRMDLLDGFYDLNNRDFE